MWCLHHYLPEEKMKYSLSLTARGRNLVLQCKATLYFHLTENGHLSNCAASFPQKNTTLSCSKNLIKLKLQTSYQTLLLLLNKNTVFQKHKKYLSFIFVTKLFAKHSMNSGWPEALFSSDRNATETFYLAFSVYRLSDKKQCCSLLLLFTADKQASIFRNFM